ncbi:membrane protein insertase YidC [Facklamia sp. DSM 111018]|uniref:Membrane protein insertase YidC n=1 Tax=Facklamia lactis TaxID=2749967 RepID=A0ABS0LT29_9LACT|nr:membrane protein insertase YidC [Facklamia lactis]MBG9981302.1 membrane protein insertase YidC [Facklamia lactis]MBG9987222.1 membrane protein insertase YidC [Facklamia lactis]
MKKKIKLNRIVILAFLMVLLSACGNINEPITSDSTGIWDGIILYNLSQFIIWLSNLFGGNFALGIILFTIIIRLLLLPLNIMQMKSQRKMMEIQPEIEAIKKKYPNKDKDSLERMQVEQQALMEERGVNQFAGCIPLLLQFPILMALYQAISRNETIRQGHFLWMNLGEPDKFFVLPVLAALLTYWNSYLNMKANPQQNISTKSMLYMMPIMIFFISLGLPSAVSLYWVISNLLSVLTTYAFNNPNKIIEERQLKQQVEKEKERQLKKALKKVKSRR